MKNTSKVTGLSAFDDDGTTDSLMLSCKHSGIDIRYLDTLRDLGVTIEIFSGTPGAEQKPDAT